MESIAERSVASATWNVGVNLVKVVVLLARSIILARLLPVETFGVYALATSIVTFTGILPTFGLGAAYLHRAPETEDEEAAAAVHFTLRLLFTVVWAVALIAIALAFTEGILQPTLIALTLIFAGLYISITPKIILARRVRHRRLAVLDLSITVVSTIAALALAWQGFGMIALVSTDLVALLLTVALLSVWRPVWRPRLSWERNTVRYFLRFGSRGLAESALGEALENLDDVWTGTYLGSHALGLYSRAYTFATYPRRLLAVPVSLVAGGTYAELKEDRLRLSQAFFRTNALLVRSGFLFGGILMLIAPEFVGLALGEKWLPMVPAFRLMAIFTLLDPIQSTVSQVFTASGRPEHVIRARLVQLVVLVGGLYLVGPTWGISGVALVLNAMFLVGLALMLYRARTYVDFSTARLVAVPLLGLLAGVTLSVLSLQLMIAAGRYPVDWARAVVKALPFALGYCGVLFAFERGELLDMLARARLALGGRDAAQEIG